MFGYIRTEVKQLNPSILRTSSIISGIFLLTVFALHGAGSSYTVTQVNSTTCGTTIPGDWVNGNTWELTASYTITPGNELEVPSGVNLYDEGYALTVDSGGSLAIDNGGLYYSQSLDNYGSVNVDGIRRA